MEDVLVDYLNPNFDLVKITSPKKCSFESKKSDVLYEGRKIIIKTPKMQLPFDIRKFGPSYKMGLSFGRLMNKQMKKLYNFITGVEESILEIFKIYRKKWGFGKMKFYSSVIEDGDYPPFISINLPYNILAKKKTFNFHVYTEDNVLMAVEEINQKSYMSALIELDDIWYTEKEFGINWKVLQMKNYKSANVFYDLCLKECLIFDPDNPISFKSNTYIEQPRAILCLPAPPMKGPPQPPMKGPPQPQKSSGSGCGENKGFRPPTKEELAEVILKMKKKNK